MADLFMGGAPLVATSTGAMTSLGAVSDNGGGEASASAPASSGERRTRREDGPACKRCARSEARCAYLAGCCEDCSHFRGLDADGNDVHGNTDRCGSDTGYSIHRKRREAACAACKSAHSLAVQRRAVS